MLIVTIETKPDIIECFGLGVVVSWHSKQHFDKMFLVIIECKGQRH